MTQLQNTTSSILRTLRQAFETDLSAIASWGNVRIDRAGPTKSAPDENGVHVSFAYGTDRYRIAVYPPDERPPLGLVKLVGAGDDVTGPIDSETFARMAHAIKTRKPNPVENAPWD